MVCKNCGFNNENDSKFCRNCGNTCDIPIMDFINQNNNQINNEQFKVEQSSNNIPNNKKSKKVKILVIFILLFVVIGSVFLVLNDEKVVQVPQFEFAESNVFLNVYDSYKLEIRTDLENVDIEYTSSDESVALVSEDGVVTAIKGGTVIITARYGDLTTQIEISVAIPEEVEKKLEFNSKELTIRKGESYHLQLSANFDYSPDEIVYEVENSNVLEMKDNGLIEAKSKGVTNVVATIGDVSAIIKIEVLSEFSIKFEQNEAQYISEKEIFCYTSSDSCQIKLPNIVAKEGYRVVGWSLDKNSNTANYNVFDTIDIKESFVLYAIVEKIKEETVYVNYMINGADSIEKITDSCKLEKGVCKIKLPSITKKNGTVIGWSLEKDSFLADYKVKEEIEIDKDITLYAITKEVKTANFYNNGVVSLTPSDFGEWDLKDDFITTSCETYNLQKTCDIYTPKKMILNNKYDKALGFSNNKSDEIQKYYFNQKIILSENKNDFYAIYKPAVEKEYKATFISNGATSISEEYKTCSTYENKCSITLPNITKLNGDVIGFSDNEKSKEAKYFSGDTIEISSDVTLYAITKQTKTAIFHYNGVSSLTQNDIGAWENGSEYIKTSCEAYNLEKTCDVYTPKSINLNNSYDKAVGFARAKINYENIYDQNSIITLTEESNDFYTIYIAAKKDERFIYFISNGATSVSETNKSCSTYEGTCSITLPNIIRENGVVIGFSEDANSKEAQYNPGQTIQVTRNMTLYAITKEVKTANFYNNGATSLTPNDMGIWENGNQYIKTSCEVYNLEKTCDVYTPKSINLNSVYDKAIGFANKISNYDKLYLQNSKITLENINNDFYAIYDVTPKKERSITFVLNGATSITETSKSCSTYEGACSIVLPNITRENGEVIGFSEDANSIEAVYTPGQTIEIDKNITLYAITKEVKEATFHYNGAISLTPNDIGVWENGDEYIKTSCIVYNLEKTCDVYTPKSINVENDYTDVLGFSEKSTASTTMYNLNSKITLTKNTNYYAITKINLEKVIVPMSQYEFPKVAPVATRKTKRVLVIEIDPYLETKDKKVSQFLKQSSNADTIISNLKSDIAYSSNNLVNVEIVGREYLDEFPTYKERVTLLNGTRSFRFDEETYLSVFEKGWYGWWNTTNTDFTKMDAEKLFDYNYFINKFDLVNRKNNNEFDEVWIISVDPVSAYETAMVGRTAYWVNGIGIKRDCDNFIIAGFTISRPDSALECLGHASEQILNAVFGTRLSYDKNSVNVTTSNYDNLNMWQKFTLVEYFNASKGTGLAGVGAIHFAPNSTADYDWSNSTYADSSWLDWKNNYPYLTGETTKVNYKTWNSSGDSYYAGRYFHRWWFSLMPHVSGYTKDGYSNNWWDYLYTFDYVTAVSSPFTTYTYNVGDKINGIAITNVYQTGNVERITLNDYQPNMEFSNPSILSVNGNGEIIATSKGSTILKYYRDGYYAQITINIK